jgi:cyanophycinase
MTPATGPIGLHGGGEFQPGDEPFLRAILEAALPPSGERPVRVVIVPTAAAGERPEMAVAFGSRAFESVAAGAGLAIDVEGVFVVDRESAADAELASRLVAAHLVYLPGGDPGRLAAVLPGSVAWAAILRANEQGAVIAGASAGAMVLAPWTWTPGGGAPGLGLVPGIVVVPHAERVGRGGWRGTFAERVPAAAGPLAPLGLEERTGILSVPGSRTWRDIGEGRVYLGGSAADAPQVFEAGDLLTLPGVCRG